MWGQRLKGCWLCYFGEVMRDSKWGYMYGGKHKLNGVQQNVPVNKNGGVDKGGGEGRRGLVEGKVRVGPVWGEGEA